jgi:osmotically-inducible protein OsmY
MQRSDPEILQDIITELKAEPSLRDDDIGVSVRDGIVTLAGYVDSYLDRWKAERVASRVRGVRAIANDLEVKLPASSVRTDPDLARAGVQVLQWNIAVPADRIRVRVDKGWVTLEGEVDYYYQKEAAERAIRSVTGVRGISNLIMVRPSGAARPDEIKRRIREALVRAAEIDADRITVEVEDGKVTLKGAVRSYAEMREAERAAANVAGVTEVENRLTVDPSVFAGV